MSPAVELGPWLSRLVAPPAPPSPAELLLSDLRLRLLTRLFESPDWRAAWHDAVAEAARLVSSHGETRLRDAAAQSRYPRAKAQECSPRCRGPRDSCGAGSPPQGSSLEESLYAKAGSSEGEIRMLCGKVEVAWSHLVSTADRELAAAEREAAAIQILEAAPRATHHRQRCTPRLRGLGRVGARRLSRLARVVSSHRKSCLEPIGLPMNRLAGNSLRIPNKLVYYSAPMDLLSLALLFFFGMPKPASQGISQGDSQLSAARRIVATANLAAEEYRLGVRDGRVIAEPEVEEARLFLAEARRNAERIAGPSGEETSATLNRLLAMVNAAASPDSLDEGVRAMVERLSERLGMPLEDVPSEAPSLARGREVYQVNCASCHAKPVVAMVRSRLPCRPARPISPMPPRSWPARRSTSIVASPSARPAPPCRPFEHGSRRRTAGQLRSMPPPCGFRVPHRCARPTAWLGSKPPLPCRMPICSRRWGPDRRWRTWPWSAPYPRGNPPRWRRSLPRSAVSSIAPMASPGGRAEEARAMAMDAYVTFERVERELRIKDPTLTGISSRVSEPPNPGRIGRVGAAARRNSPRPRRRAGAGRADHRRPALGHQSGDGIVHHPGAGRPRGDSGDRRA